MLDLMSRCFVAVALLLAVFTITTSAAEAADPPKPTIITVGEMCGGCVKQIKKRFDNVKGIASVQCDVESKTVTMLPAKGYRLNPRNIWAGMEEIGKTPVKLVGPSGTYTSKPKE